MMLFPQKRFTVSDDELKYHMGKGWGGGQYDGTICGAGSTIKSTQEIRKVLPQLFQKYNIKVINDAGCGDLHWIKHILTDDIDYQGYDIVARNPSVIELDISSRLMRKCDLIICKDVFIHLRKDRVKSALLLFKSVCKYLFTNLFIGDILGNEPLAVVRENRFIAQSGEKPFSLNYGFWDLTLSGQNLRKAWDAPR